MSIGPTTEPKAPHAQPSDEESQHGARCRRRRPEDESKFAKPRHLVNERARARAEEEQRELGGEAIHVDRREQFSAARG